MVSIIQILRRYACIAMAVFFALRLEVHAQPLTQLEYTVSGQVMEVTPAVLSVPKGLPGSVGVAIAGEVPTGAFVEAVLRGPSFPARRIVGLPNQPLVLPPLNLVGDYSLDGIRLVSAAGETLLDGTPSTVPVRVFDEVLVSRVTSRPLSLEEIEERGIEIDDRNFRAVEFEVGFVVDGKTFPVKFPVIAPSFRQTTEIVPAAELEERLAQAEALNSQVASTVGLPEELERVLPDIQIKGLNMELGAGSGEGDLALQIPPIPALMVIPGNIGFLNQFFSVQIYTENAAPLNSGLSVRELTAELKLPAGPDLTPGTNEAPGDDPLRMARVNGVVQAAVPVRNPGPDGKVGTADDIDRLLPGQTGQGELLVEGLQEGLHVMELALRAKLDGLAGGAVDITGKAAGSILVRNPKFSMAFSHPRTVRTGEPYEAVVTILNTSSTVANLVSIELNSNNISGGILESASRVELGTIVPGETKSATFRVRAQKTGAITFSNLTTSDDSLIGRFRLKTGVDERGVALSPDTLLLPEFVDVLPAELLAAAQRVLGQALSTNKAGQLPPGVKKVSKRLVNTRIITLEDGTVEYKGEGSRLQELLEAAMRVRYGDPLARVLPDLLLDWQGARDFDAGWDQIVRETDAGREWREALMQAMEAADPQPDPAVTRLVDRGRDLAGRGESWLMAASDRGAIDLEHGVNPSADGQRSAVEKAAVYAGTDGDWLAAKLPGVVRWRVASAITGEAQFNAQLIRDGGTAREFLWRISDLPAGAVVIFDPAAGGELASVDENGDGVAERTVAATGTDFTELPPEVMMVMQDPEVHVARPSRPCPNPTSTNDRGESVRIMNYANLLAVLFSKPMTQETADVPSAYRLEDGNEAAFVRMQNGGRVALITMKGPVGALIPRTMSVTGAVTDARGNAMAPVTQPVVSRLFEGVTVKGRVIRADGSFAANVPVTLTYDDTQESGLGGDCLEWTRRMAQVRTDATGAFAFDFVVGGIPYTISATDTSGLSEAAIDLILRGSVKGQVDAERLNELVSRPEYQDTLLAEFGTGATQGAIAKAEGLDRATVSDNALPSRFASESAYALRFRGRGTVTGQVLLADGETPAVGAAVNLFPDVNSRELGRGVLADSAGRFAFQGVPLGPFSVEAENGAGLTRVVSGLIGDQGGSVEVTVVLSETPPGFANWQGRVTEPDGTPVAGAPVFVAAGKGVVHGQAVTNELGYWSVARVPVGSFTVYALSLDGKRKGQRGPLTSADGLTMTANVVLQGRAEVEGVVQFANGDPVAGAVVGGGDRLVTTDALGRFTLPGVPTGRGTISAGFVGIPGHADPRKQLTRLASTQLDVQVEGNFAVIRFVPQGRIIGQVKNEQGQPVPNVNVALPFPFADQPFFFWVKADAQGRYEFPGLGLSGPIQGAYDLSAPAPPVQEPFDGEGAAAKLKDASEEEVAAIIGEAFAAFSGVNNPLLTGGVPFNPNVFGFRKGVRLDFDGETEVADITYLGPSRLSGRVENGQGVPIGARVRLTGIGPNAVGYPTFITRAEINSDPALGTFDFNGQAFVGDWGLQAASPFFPTVISTSGRTTPLDNEVTGILLRFPPVQEINGSLTGSVLLPDGSPAGANVEVSIQANAQDDPRVVRTDAAGRFTTGAALFSLRGNTPYTVTVFDPATGGKAQLDVYVRAGQDNVVTVPLLGRGSLEVLVTRADGTPVPGAVVEAEGGQFPKDELEGVADATGRVVFSNVFEGPYGLSANAVIGLTRVAGREGALVVKWETAQATVRLSATATIQGLFVQDDGVTPVGGANVRLGNFAYAPTDMEGRFTFADVPLGTHVLTAVNAVTGRGGNTTVNLTSNGETVNVRLLESPLGTVTGLVINTMGDGVVPGAEVTLDVDDSYALVRQTKVTSGPDGRYVVTGVVPGGFTVSARSVTAVVLGNSAGTLLGTGEARSIMPAGAAEVVVDVPLAPKATIRAQVMQADGVTPAANARVTLMFGDAGRITGDANAEGLAVFEGLQLTGYGVQAISTEPGATRSRSQITEVVLSDRGQVEELTCVLRGVGAVTGVVVEADGVTPAAGAEVRLTTGIVSPTRARVDLATPVDETMVVGADGVFEFDDLPPGVPISLRATRLGLAAAETVETVIAGQTVTRNLELTASGSVVGRVLREGSLVPAASVEVVVEFPSRSGLQGAILQITGDDGRFELSPVPEGPWSLRALRALNGGLVTATGAITANGEVDDVGDLILDEAVPEVVATEPVDTAEGVDVGQTVTVTFSEPITAASLNATGVFLRPAGGGPVVPAVLTQPSPEVVVLDPVGALESETTYNIVVVDGELKNAVGVVTNTGPRDRVGRALERLFSATFTTRDQRPPAVLSFTPSNGAVQVDPRSVVRLSFDEPVRPDVVFSLTGPSGPIAGASSLGVNNLVLTFVPSVPLPVNASFTATLSNVQDLAGNFAVGQPFTRSFATLDTLGPEIALLRIKGGAATVGGSTVVLEAVLAAAETGVRYRLTANGVNAGTSAEDVLEIPLTLPESGTLVFRGIAIDRFGNEGPLAELTVVAQPNQPPVVVLERVSPAEGPVLSSSAFSVRITATDDGAVADLRAAAMGAAVVPLRTSTGAPLLVQGSVSPTAVPGSKVRILASAEDSSGVSSGEQVFELEVADGSPPVVAVASPAVNAVVPPGEFVLDVDWRDNSGAATLEVALSGGGASGTQSRAVTGTANVNSREMFTFDLSGVAPVGSTFTAQVTATDAAGRSSSVTRAFVIPDLIPPRLLSVTPADGAVKQNLWNAGILVLNFDEPIGEAALNPALYELTGPAGTIPVFGVTRQGNSLRLNLYPVLSGGPLDPGESYQVRVPATVADAAGNGWRDVGDVAVPPEGRVFSFETATVTQLLPVAGSKIVPGQTIPVTFAKEVELGADTILVRFAGGPTQERTGHGFTTNLTLPVDATEARLILQARNPFEPTRLSNLGRFGEVLLDLRPRGDDDDGDGWLNGFEVDNGMNPFVANADGDDFDNDGLTNGQERTLGTNPAKADTDDDGLNDSAEIAAGTNPLNPDTDGDLIPDGKESLFGTNPLLADTDGDGLSDGAEVGYGRLSVVSGSFTWEEAKADAESRGGHLVTITSALESTAVLNVLPELATGGGWIGLTDRHVEGAFRWVTGELSSFTNFASGEPNNFNGDEDFVQIRAGFNGQWNDAPAAARDRYVLETGFYTNPLVADTDGDGINDNLDPFIGPQNQSPVAVGDAFSANTGESLTMQISTELLANDSDPNGDPLGLASFTQPVAGGTVSRPAADALVFTPALGFSGSTSFTYTLQDAGGLTATATVQLLVGTNTRPMAGTFGLGASLHALAFDGVDDLVEIAVDGGQDLSQMGSWTIEAWVRPTVFNNTAFPTIYSQGSWRASLGIQASTGKADSWINNAAQQVSLGGLNAGGWMHVILVHDGTNRRFYLNGVPSGVQASSLPTTDGFPIRIGAAGTSSLRTDSLFSGRLDEVRVWNRALGAEEIGTAAGRRLGGREAGLAAYWSMEDGAGTGTTDDTLAGRIGSLGGGQAERRPQWVISDAPVLGYRQMASVVADRAGVIAQQGEDADDQPLTAKITRLPLRGALFQYVNGAAGAAITSVPTVVSDANRRVVYVPETGFTGEDGWRFTVSDGIAESEAALLRLQVVPDSGLAAEDVWSLSQGATVTASSAIAAGSSAGNAFDGTAAELVFGDGAAAGFAHFVEWQTPGTVMVDGARLFAADGGIVGRGVARMRLYGKLNAGDAFTLLATYEVPDNPYFGGELRTEVRVESFVGTQFRAEFDAAVAGQGPRVTELDAVGEAVAVRLVNGPVTLQNATATATQSSFSASGTIDGVTTGTNGWALGSNTAQTIVWETSANVQMAADGVLSFDLIQNFDASHHLGRFRLSATTDDRSTFADGLANGGDVTANWTVLEVVSFAATGGPVGTVQGDQSVLVSGPQPNGTTYTVRVRGIAGSVTGFRLEMLKDASLPSGGPGRAGNGNMVLNEVTVAIEDVITYSRAPRGTPDAVETIQGVALSISPLSNDSDPEGDAITIASFTQPPAGEGMVTAAGATQLLFTPEPGFTGVTSFSYRPTDGLQSGAPTTVTVTVRPSLERKWINPAGGNWSVAANWLNGQVPSADDIAVFDEPGTYTVTVDGNVTISKLRLGATSGVQTLRVGSGRALTVLNGGTGSGSGRLLVNGGTAVFGAATAFGSLSLEGGALSGAGTVTVNSLGWTSGTMAGSGTTRLAAGGTGTLSGTNTKAINNSRVIENQGTLVYSGDNVIFNFGAVGTGRLLNAVGATFEIQGEADISNSSAGPNAFENAGLLRKTGGGTTSFTSSIAMTNTGSVQVESGALQLQGGGTNQGAIVLNTGTTLRLSGGTFTHEAGASMTGEFLLLADGATVNLQAGISSSASLSMSGGSISTMVDQTVSSLAQSGGTLAGSAILTVSGSLSWTSGAMSGSGTTRLAAGATGTVSGTSTKAINNSRVIENRGSLVYSGDNVFFNVGATGTGRIVNAVGATWEVQGEADISHSTNGTNGFENAGLLRKTGGGTTSFTSSISLTNTDSIQIENGTLQLQGGGTNPGAIVMSSGTVLRLSGGTFNHEASASMTGNVNLLVEGATVNLLEGIASGTSLTLSAGVVVASIHQPLSNLTQSGGTLTGSAILTVTGSLVWTGGNMSGSGTTRIAPGATGSISGSGTKALNNSRVLENQGSLVYGGDNLLFGVGGAGTGQIINAAGATLEIQGESDFGISSVGNYALENAGILRKTGAGTATIAGLPLNTSGTLQLEEGVLQFNGGGTLGGTADLAAGTTLRMTGGTVAVAEGISVIGAGSLLLDGGTLLVNVDASLPRLAFTSGTLTGSATLTLEQSLNWSAGQMGGTGRTVLAVGASSAWSGSGVKDLNNARVLENRGSVLYDGGLIRFGLSNGSSGRIENKAGATFEIQGGLSVGRNTGTHVFENAGLLRKTGAGSAEFAGSAVVLDNSGTVSVESGTLNLNGGGLLGGTWQIGAACELRLPTGSYQTVVGGSFSGAGTVVLAGAELTVGEDATMPRLNFDSGTLNGAGELTITGAFSWKAGIMGATGRTVLGVGATSVWNTTAIKDINNARVFENRGSVVFEAGAVRFGLSNSSSGQIQNVAGATFEFQGETDLGLNTSGTYPFTNAGTLRKTGVGTTTFATGGVSLDNTGTVRVEGGTLQLSGGFTQNGTVSGNGTLTASFTNNGIIRPDALPGLGLTLSGNLTQAASGRIELTVGARDPSLVHRSLAVTGSATLNGTLQILTDPAFNEPGGSLFDVMTFATRSGDFAATEGLTGNPAFDFNRSFTGTALRLEVNSALPEAPETLAVAMPQVGQSGRDEVLSGQELAMAQPEGDADRDGVGNLLELAFGSDPLDASDTGRPELGPDLEHPGCLRFAVPLGPEAAELGFEVEYTNDMNLWHTLTQQTPGVMQMQTLTDIQGLPFLEVCIDPAVTGTIFLRVKVWQTQTK